MKEKIRVLLVDDHTIVRKGLRLILELHDRIEICGEASSLKETMEDDPPVSMPDVILLDFKLPDGDGVEGCKRIKSQFPDIKNSYFNRLFSGPYRNGSNSCWSKWLFIKKYSGGRIN